MKPEEKSNPHFWQLINQLAYQNKYHHLFGDNTGKTLEQQNWENFITCTRLTQETFPLV